MFGFKVLVIHRVEESPACACGDQSETVELLKQVLQNINSLTLKIEKMETNFEQIKTAFNDLKTAIQEERQQAHEKLDELQASIDSLKTNVQNGGSDTERTQLLADIQQQITEVRGIIPDPAAQQPENGQGGDNGGGTENSGDNQGGATS